MKFIIYGIDLIGMVKKCCILTFSLLLISNLYAQKDTIIPVDKDPEELLKKLNLGGHHIPAFNIWNDSFKGHWSGLDFGFNLFINEDYSGYETPFMNNDVFRSNSAFINLVQKNFGLQRNRNTIGLITGIGLHLQSYRLENNRSFSRTDDGRIEPQTLIFEHNQKSKFSITSIIIPLLTEFQIPVNHYNNRLYISGGMYGGIRIASHTKIKYRIEGKKEKLKTPGHYSLQDIRYGLMVRTGYRWINLFATYDLVPLFKENKGPELTPVTFGITLISL